mmetsp:Transcript_14124/g.36584  ORF Transcript_14124/g.36584 Transcript_14124/m.36584 type:complete len:285 (-) Transcript_14124:649-1503(-)
MGTLPRLVHLGTRHGMLRCASAHIGRPRDRLALPAKLERHPPTRSSTFAAALSSPEGWKPYDASMRRAALPPDSGAFTVVSWNVAGLRALLRKDPHAMRRLILEHRPAVICLQETKLQVRVTTLWAPYIPTVWPPARQDKKTAFIWGSITIHQENLAAQVNGTLRSGLIHPCLWLQIKLNCDVAMFRCSIYDVCAGRISTWRVSRQRWSWRSWATARPGAARPRPRGWATRASPCSCAPSCAAAARGSRLPVCMRTSIARGGRSWLSSQTCTWCAPTCRTPGPT